MDISIVEAFAHVETNPVLDDDVKMELQGYFADMNPEMNVVWMRTLLLAFQAGMVYQSQFAPEEPEYDVSMSPLMLLEFTEFLIGKVRGE